MMVDEDNRPPSLIKKEKFHIVEEVGSGCNSRQVTEANGIVVAT